MIRTFQDAVDSLRDLAEFTSDTRNHRNARRAVMEAYNEIGMRGPWSRFSKTFQIVVPAEYSTGTIAYTHSTYTVTLTGGTFPTNAESRRLVVNNIPHRVKERVSGTELRLWPEDNPGADVAALTTYRLVQDIFTLPSDFHEVTQLVDTEQQCEIPVTRSSGEAHYRFLTGEYTAQSVNCAVILGAIGQQSLLQIVPPATSGTVLNLLYRARPRPLVLEEYSTGTIAISSGSASATFTGSSLPENCAGSTIRIASGLNRPTNEIGRDVDGAHVVVPIAFETTIAERLSATTARLDNPSPAAFSASAFVISDPLDIDLAVMLQPFQRLAEASFLALMQGTPTRESIQRMQLARAAAIDAIQFALQDDRKILAESTSGHAPVEYWRRPHSDAD